LTLQRAVRGVQPLLRHIIALFRSKSLVLSIPFTDAFIKVMSR
jgi:hypothetical protein